MTSGNSAHNEIMVSVLMVTYNHASYIAEAIESILMQKTSFRYELVIGEDCSTDCTREIVQEYKSRNPDRIRLLLHEKNLGPYRNGFETLRACRGRYIAFCDGDDYWTDSKKLQKQVDFLEQNLGYALCCGAFENFDDVSKKRFVINKASDRSPPGGFSFSLDDMLRNWLTKTLTVMLRREILSDFLEKSYAHRRDIHMFYHAVKAGRAYYFDSVFGAYRVHGGGLHSGNLGRFNRNISYECYRELYEKNGDTFTRKMYLMCTLGLFNFDLSNAYEENTLARKKRLLFEAIRTAKSGDEYFGILKSLVPRGVKNALKRLVGKSRETG